MNNCDLVCTVITSDIVGISSDLGMLCLVARGRASSGPMGKQGSGVWGKD